MFKKFNEKKHKEEVAGVKMLYEDFLNQFKLTDAQAFSFAMNMLTDVLVTMDEKRRNHFMTHIPIALHEGVLIKMIMIASRKDNEITP